MKRISHTNKSKSHLLHIETDLGVINIRVGLEDVYGQRVESIELIPNDTCEDPKVVTDNEIRNVRFIEKARIPKWGKTDITREFLVKNGKPIYQYINNEKYLFEDKFYRCIWASPCERIEDEGGWMTFEVQKTK